MIIMTSLPADLTSTIDMDLSVTPRQLLAEIKTHFTDSTPTTHLILKQEAQRTKTRAGGDLDEYIAAHRTIRAKMSLAEYRSIQNDESVTIESSYTASTCTRHSDTCQTCGLPTTQSPQP